MSGTAAARPIWHREAVSPYDRPLMAAELRPGHAEPPTAGTRALLRTESAHDLALQTVLERLTGGLPDHRDTPDGWITAVRRLEARDARYAPFPEGVDPRLRDLLAARGVGQLYTHQAVAVEHALARRHVVITTPTEVEKHALVADEGTPFFTIDHFKGYSAVLVQQSRLGETTREELVEIITDAWAAKAPKKLVREHLGE